MTFAAIKCPTLNCGANTWRLRRETRTESEVDGLRAICLRCRNEYRVGITKKEAPWPTSPASPSTPR